jgi:hypothetical protein
VVHFFCRVINRQTLSLDMELLSTIIIILQLTDEDESSLKSCTTSYPPGFVDRKIRNETPVKAASTSQQPKNQSILPSFN